MIAFMSKKKFLYISLNFLTCIDAFTAQTKTCSSSSSSYTKLFSMTHNPSRSYESDYRRGGHYNNGYDRLTQGDYDLSPYPNPLMDPLSFGTNYYPEDNLSRRHGDVNSRNTRGNNRFNSRTNTGMIRSDPTSSVRLFKRISFYKLYCSHSCIIHTEGFR